MAEWINFAELRARVSLEDVIVRYYGITTLKRDGPKLIGPCPVHGGDSPRAFHADLGKNVWHCFSQCQKGGNQLDFVALKENIGVREAALRLQAFLGGAEGPRPAPPAPPTSAPTTPPKAKTPASAAPPPAPADYEGNPVLTIKLDLKNDHPHLITDRRLRIDTIDHFGIGYCGRGILRGMIAIPIHDEDGDLVAYAGRRLKPSDIREFGKYKLPKGFKKERVLYNYHRAKGSTDGIILVEGFFSVMKLYEAGFPNVVASMGVELSEYQAQRLSAAAEVIILFDGDEAGRRGAANAAEKLAAHTVVRVAQLPSRLEPDDLSGKALRWLINGMRALNLLTVSFAFRGDEPTPTIPPTNP